jgi:cytochrome b6-f complex iron-sulfur subunit
MPDETEQSPKPAKADAETAVAKAAPSGALATAGGPAVVVVQPAPVGLQVPAVSRRKVMLIGFWGAMGAMMLGIVTTILNSLYPRNVAGFGGSVYVGTLDQLKSATGQKLHNLDAKAWIVLLTGEQVRRNPGAQEGSVIALYHKCPHLGCTVPWRADFSREDPRNLETYGGWFLCPCHGSTYSDAGVRVFGPAPRSMDTMELSITDGKMTVNTGKIRLGDETNPTRAILPG